MKGDSEKEREREKAFHLKRILKAVVKVICVMSVPIA